MSGATDPGQRRAIVLLLLGAHDTGPHLVAAATTPPSDPMPPAPRTAPAA